jgi:putative ABC transport system permease protein
MNGKGVNGNSLALRLALRELRAELRGGLTGFRIFLACLALGVAAIAGVGTLSEAFVRGLKDDSRNLLGGDIDLRLLHRAASKEQLDYLKQHSKKFSLAVRMRAMASKPDTPEERALVEFKAVDGVYPLVGSTVLQPARPLAELLKRKDGVAGAVADGILLSKLGLKTGDTIKVGDGVFQIRGIILKEPDRAASVFNLGPRLMIDRSALKQTGLVRPGSQIRYHYRVTLENPKTGNNWIEALNKAFPSAGWRIRGVDEAAPGIRRFIERMTLFFSFVGLTSLLVGGIGIANAVSSYLESRTDTIATFKCLGAPGNLVFRIYMLQILMLGAFGTVLGLGLGIGLPAITLGILAEMLPVVPRAGVYFGPIWTAAAFGMATTFTFALLPLARARDVPAQHLFRRQVNAISGWPRKRYRAALLIAVIGLAVLTLLTTSDRYFAAWFIGCAIATLAILRLSAMGVMAAARRVKNPPGAVGRLVLANLHRPGAATPSIFLSLGLGLTVLVAIALIEGNLSRQVNERLPEQAPAFFFIDIQPHQVQAFDKAVKSVPGTSGFRRVPSLRGRIVRIAGKPVKQVKIAPKTAWAVRGDRALTYTAIQPKDTKVVAGTWWPENYQGEPLISFDAGLARGFGVGIGDTLTLNILGREVTAKIGSLREIDWRSLRFDFAIIFAPGTLEGAPHTHIAAIEVPRSGEDAVEKALSKNFTNVSAIRVREALEAAATILAGIRTAIRGAASIAILAGALVLAGAVAAGHRRRIYDAVVFKVLGATRNNIMRAYLLEYGILGLSTGIIAATVGSVTAWAVVVHLMHSDWTYLPSVAGFTVVLCMAVTLVLGFTGTWRALGQHAALHLRNE